MPHNDLPPLICLAGPTGSGKTEAAIHLARAHGGGVVNFDSRQVYRDFPIITAQPSPDELAQCPHRLFGFLGCGERISAGVFTDMAAQAIEATRADGLLPILAGGTGLYLRTLLKGIAPIPDVDPAFSARVAQACEARGLAASHALLARVDPVFAARVHPHDKQRIMRGLEVFESSGKPLSFWHAQPVPPPRWRALVIGLRIELDDLAPRLGARIDAMLAAGAEAEARRAWAACPDPAAPGWSGIGCREMLGYITGALPLDEARRQWMHNTRAYAKRQLTWFRADPDIAWVEPGDYPAMDALADAFLERRG
ncbi:MAG: tRNA (adenosine(37)-N6)-dimethylallyltransferase MiaA [Desulfovibrionaceae bacterium]